MLFVQYIDERIMPILAERGVNPVRFNFGSLDEFLKNSHIQVYYRDPNFERFVICRGKEYEIISRLKSGKHYKIGYLDGDMKEIPEWCGEKIIVKHKAPILT